MTPGQFNYILIGGVEGLKVGEFIYFCSPVTKGTLKENEPYRYHVFLELLVSTVLFVCSILPFRSFTGPFV